MTGRAADTFKLEPSAPQRRNARPGAFIAYYTSTGGGPRGRWVRAMVLYQRDGAIMALDQDGDLVWLESWERCQHRPPVLKPRILSEWMRALA